jgi:hypothetical protein
LSVQIPHRMACSRKLEPWAGQQTRWRRNRGPGPCSRTVDEEWHVTGSPWKPTQRSQKCWEHKPPSGTLRHPRMERLLEPHLLCAPALPHFRVCLSGKSDICASVIEALLLFTFYSCTSTYPCLAGSHMGSNPFPWSCHYCFWLPTLLSLPFAPVSSLSAGCLASQVTERVQISDPFCDS